MGLEIDVNQFELEDFIFDSRDALKKLIFQDNDKGYVMTHYLGSGEQALYHILNRLATACEQGAFLPEIVPEPLLESAREFMALLDTETCKHRRSARFIELSAYFVYEDTPEDMPDYRKELIKEAYSALQHIEYYTLQKENDLKPLRPGDSIQVGNREEISAVKLGLNIYLRRLEEILDEIPVIVPDETRKEGFSVLGFNPLTPSMYENICNRSWLALQEH